MRSGNLLLQISCTCKMVLPCLPLFQGVCITSYRKLLFDGSAHPLRIAFYVHFLSFCFKLDLSYGCDWLMHCSGLYQSPRDFLGLILASYFLNTPINSFIKIRNQSRVSVFKVKFTSSNFHSRSLVVKFCK